MELDSDSFQDVMNAYHKPIVLLAASPKDQFPETIERVKDVARKWRANKGATNVVFTWMDSDKWAKWLKSMYGFKESGVVIADHSVSLMGLFNMRSQGLTLTSCRSD